MEINGLPAHVLVLHAAVVLGPLAGLAALLYAAVPGRRATLRWPMVVTALAAAGAVWAAVLTGQDFLDGPRFAGVQGELAAQLALHEERGELLRWFASGLAVAAVVAARWQPRAVPARVALHLALAVLGVLTVVWTVLTGDAGAQAVWGG